MEVDDQRRVPGEADDRMADGILDGNPDPNSLHPDGEDSQEFGTWLKPRSRRGRGHGRVKPETLVWTDALGTKARIQTRGCVILNSLLAFQHMAVVRDAVLRMQWYTWQALLNSHISRHPNPFTGSQPLMMRPLLIPRAAVLFPLLVPRNFMTLSLLVPRNFLTLSLPFQ